MRKSNLTTVKMGIRKAIAAMGVGLCVLGMCDVPVQANETEPGYIQVAPLTEGQYGGANITDGGSDTGLARYGLGFASKYDPRTLHMVSKNIEDQGATESCWAFSSIAAIECNLIKKGYENENVNLSENHTAFFFYNRQTDPVGYTQGDKNNTYPFRDWSQNGGTIQGTALSLATWSGVVKETASEDYDRDINIEKGQYKGAYKPTILPASDCYKSDYKVKNTYFYKYSVANVKQAINDYGAVAAGMWMDWDCYMNDSAFAYYCPDARNEHSHAGGHAIAIVGWDDNYSRNNFKSSSRPKNNGAWIVKNSYGSNPKVGDNGYIYISYEDASLSEIVAFDMVKASEGYAKNYQYDGTANPAFGMTYPSGTSYANVFQVKGNNGCNEILKAVAVEVLTTNVNYSVQIYTGVTSKTNPTSGKAMLSSPQTGTFKNAGYNQITLNTPVTLTPGEKFAVVVKLTTNNGSVPYLGCEVSYNATWISFTANAAAGQSFAYYNKKWVDVGKSKSNLRIKAFTDNTNQKTSYSLTKKTLNLSKGSSEVLGLATNPSSVKRNITWTSGNKKIATVDKKGKVKGKSYGTTTIKAKFVAGSSTKTLKCKVTVGPTKLKGFKATGGKGKITASWKKNGSASGYIIYYSTNKNTDFKKLGTVSKSSAKKYTKKKISPGVYYVKMQAYRKKGSKKLCGSYTDVRQVIVR